MQNSSEDDFQHAEFTSASRSIQVNALCGPASEKSINPGNYKIEQIPAYVKSFVATGAVVGFSCVESQNAVYCYVATKQ